jgi:hypothetical protein
VVVGEGKGISGCKWQAYYIFTFLLPIEPHGTRRLQEHLKQNDGSGKKRKRNFKFKNIGMY